MKTLRTVWSSLGAWRLLDGVRIDPLNIWVPNFHHLGLEKPVLRTRSRGLWRHWIATQRRQPRLPSFICTRKLLSEHTYSLECFPLNLLVHMARRSLDDLQKLSQHQLNSIRKGDFIQSIFSTPMSREDSNLAMMTHLIALIAEVAEIKKALTAPNSKINRQVRDYQDQVTRRQEIIAKQQRLLEDTELL